jgi:hypothetical protein
MHKSDVTPEPPAAPEPDAVASEPAGASRCHFLRSRAARLAGAAICATLLAAAGSTVSVAPAHATDRAQGADRTANQKKPPLVLAGRGDFFTGGQIVTRTFPPGTTNRILVGQAYVEYSIPWKLRYGRNTPPIILTHNALAGTLFGSTPDGREGWYDHFVRAGFPVYVVDPPGTGRAGFNVDQYNLVQTGQAAPSTQPILAHGDSAAWEGQNIGPTFGARGPIDPTCIGNDGLGNPPITCYGWLMPNDGEALEHWLGYFPPDSGPSPSAVANGAYIELLERTGRAIWLGWSGGAGFLGGRLAQARPELFKALIGVEPNSNCLYAAATNPPLGGAVEVPALSIHGINQIGRPDGRNSRAECEAYYAKINAAGGDATYQSLYDIGIYGNSHMMFIEENNEQIAGVLLDWIDKHVERKRS